MTGTDNPFIVSPDWLQKRLGEPGLVVIDGSWYLPQLGRDARREHDAGHIPGAIFFDHDEVVEPGIDLPHALPTPRHFAQYAGSMGVRRDDTIVVYDGPGFFSAPRVWWMFRVMGAEKVFLLDGGLDGWTAEDRPLTREQTRMAGCLFEVDFDAGRVASLDDMRRIVETREAQIADARPAGRFSGADPEPRPGMRSGHMPGARNLPFMRLLKDGHLLPADELKRAFAEAGIDLEKPVVTSCGSGVTAAVITLALESVGHTDNRLYDGSWSQWGGLKDTPVVTGDS